MSPLFLCNVTLEMWVPKVTYLHVSYLRNMLLQQFHNVCLCGRENIGLVRVLWDFNFNVSLQSVSLILIADVGNLVYRGSTILVKKNVLLIERGMHHLYVFHLMKFCKSKICQ